MTRSEPTPDSAVATEGADYRETARHLAAEHYRRVVKDTGSARPRKVFAKMISDLPFPLEQVPHSGEIVGGAPTTGHAWTDFNRRVHYMSISDQLTGVARAHTIAHELYHLAFHTPTPGNIDQIAEYYGAILAERTPGVDQDGSYPLPAPVLRLLIQQTAGQPHRRAELSSMWEVEAEWFAMLVSTRRDMISFRPSKSRLMQALGAPRARR